MTGHGCSRRIDVWLRSSRLALIAFLLRFFTWPLECVLCVSAGKHNTQKYVQNFAKAQLKI